MTASLARTGAGVHESGSLRPMIILCADDYGLTDGVSRAIGELSAARRISATSVLVTGRHWPASAPRLLAHRGHMSIGLHLNLTLGAPLGPMRRLTPEGRFPPRDKLISRALAGLLDREEIAAEIGRQLTSFETGLGHPPDHVDGHEHVHVLPGVRHALLRVLAARYPHHKPLVRNPSGRAGRVASAGTRAKALAVRVLALGFARAAHRRGLPTNDGFSGFSGFDVRLPYAEELADAFREPAGRHIVMCHPGHVDDELARTDPVVARRHMEYEVLMHDHTLPERIWRPSRPSDGPPLSWT